MYWLITGKHLPRPFDVFAPRPYILVVPFASNQHPREISELLERPEYNWEPGPEDIPAWADAWCRLGQVLSWQLPTGLKAQLLESRERRGCHRDEEEDRGDLESFTVPGISAARRTPS
jgi:hypothetical protein